MYSLKSYLKSSGNAANECNGWFNHHQSRWSLPNLGYRIASSITHHLQLDLFSIITIGVTIDHNTKDLGELVFDYAAQILVVL